uniref:Cytochrome p450 3049A1 n=1 Tax=Brachionus koreanus TaxID=1199090 RepID=W8RYU3_9BILA|nr:cytochrome p450 3049A1 [Brachionus koreanus]
MDLLRNLTLKEIGLLLFSSTSSFLIYLTLKQYIRLKRYRHIPHPKTSGLFRFFTGNLNELQALKDDIGFSGLILKWFNELGPVFKVYFFGEIIVSVNGPEAVKKVTIDLDLHKNDLTYNLLAFPYSERALGTGLVTEIDKDKWKKSRALFNHAFQRNVLKTFLDEFNQKSNLLMEKLRSKADGKTMVTMFPEVNKLALDIISSVAFGFNNNSINQSENYLNKLIINLLEGINELLVDPLVQIKPNKLKMIKEFKNSLKELREFSRDHINQRIKDLENKEHVPNDILTIIIKNYDGDSFDMDDLIDQFLTFFIAGQETTANSLAFAILELGRNPESFLKLREEVDKYIGFRNYISLDDLANLDYTSCVFKETLRKYPPAPEFSRKTHKEIEINGVKIPANTWLMCSPYISGHNPEYFPEPEEFKPERFLKESEFSKKNLINSYTFFPFSLGPRNCIGQNFAKIEAKIFLAKFVQNFDIRLDESQSYGQKELLTLRPKDGCRVYLSQRSF